MDLRMKVQKKKKSWWCENLSQVGEKLVEMWRWEGGRQWKLWNGKGQQVWVCACACNPWRLHHHRYKKLKKNCKLHFVKMYKIFVVICTFYFWHSEEVSSRCSFKHSACAGLQRLQNLSIEVRNLNSLNKKTIKSLVTANSETVIVSDCIFTVAAGMLSEIADIPTAHSSIHLPSPTLYSIPFNKTALHYDVA